MDNIGDSPEWSEWLPFYDALAEAGNDRRPGVYRARHSASNEIFYVGCAHRRSVYARLTEYKAGNDLNGLGEVLFDLALSDPEWLRERLQAVEAGNPTRAVQWLRDALDRADVEISFALVDDGPSAQELEQATLGGLPVDPLRNKWAVRRREGAIDDEPPEDASDDLGPDDEELDTRFDGDSPIRGDEDEQPAGGPTS